MCCGVVYRGRYGEVLIHPHLYKPCCPRTRPAMEERSQQGAEESLPAARAEEGEEKEEEEEMMTRSEGGLSEAAR